MVLKIFSYDISRMSFSSKTQAVEEIEKGGGMKDTKTLMRSLKEFGAEKTCGEGTLKQ